MRAVAVIGNPKLGSRTQDAARRLAAALGAEYEAIEVAKLGTGLLAWGDPAVAGAIASVQAADIVIAASPTFKASYSGLLKMFLDQFAGGTGMKGVVGIPLMLGAGPSHALASEILLKPVLVELGATCPAQGLYLIDHSYTEDGALGAWAEQWGAVVKAAARKE